MIRKLNLSNNKRKTINVPVPNFEGGIHGEDAEITITEMTVEGYCRNGMLQREILERKDISETRRTSLLMCAALMSVMVDPETGDFLMPESDIDAFHAVVDKETLDALLVAHGELNPPKAMKTFEAKKKTY